MLRPQHAAVAIILIVICANMVERAASFDVSRRCFPSNEPPSLNGYGLTSGEEDECFTPTKDGEKEIFPTLSRRMALEVLHLATAPWWIPFYPIQHRAFASTVRDGLVFDRLLGKGAFKTVYLVSSNSTQQQYAAAVEPIRSKSAAKEALIGIDVTQELERRIQSQQHYHALSWDCFEHVVDWWFQSTVPFPPDGIFLPGAAIQIDGGTQTIPSKFLGRTKWLISLKPVYTMDLQTFTRNAPLIYHVGGERHIAPSTIAGLPLDKMDTTALQLAYQMCEAGALMHRVGLVHRDIKLKNVMLDVQGRPVIIDFGFAQFVLPLTKDRLCIEQPGKLKGDPNYMLARDAAKYQGCTEGDAFAMGKTLHEVMFGLGADLSSGSSVMSSSLSFSRSSFSNKKVSSVGRIRAKENEFRLRLKDEPSKSRFALSTSGRGALMTTIRSLCRDVNPIRLDEAAASLLQNR